MDGSETIKKTCLVCKLTKDETEFVIGRNTCKRCRNEKVRKDYVNLVISVDDQQCNTCKTIK